MFLSLGVIIIVGFLGGLLFNKIHLPRLVFYIVLGILIGPSLLNIVDKDLLEISAYLRQIALIIILTRSGLSLSLKTLKEIGRPAILLSFVPASFEILGIVIFGPILLNISFVDSLLLGSVLAAVSPAIVVPRMIKAIEDGYDRKNHAPELVLAGASADDVYVIVLFYLFKGILSTNSFSGISLLMMPISIILGLCLGIVGAFGMKLIFKHLNTNSLFNTVLFLGMSFLFLGIEALLKPYVSISSLLGIMAMAMMVLSKNKEQAVKLKKNYDGIWFLFEIVLFVLVGCETKIGYAFSKDGAIILGLIMIALVFRIIGVLTTLLFTKYSFKQKLFIVLSYIPKATVQASIGGIALAEGLSCGTLVLTAAVISILFTAPIGAILIDTLTKKLLVKDNEFITNV